ncbi:unnamed protein product [Pleuronectes platessa]|uniref:Uncharacterized protein n=1 Tax=Pleuronectes platessa TaxID=8262 RepID=A0A9N7UWX0_PLEPL|nr:unnamed protein product [Pleuronectes platessa]
MSHSPTSQTDLWTLGGLKLVQSQLIASVVVLQSLLRSPLSELLLLFARPCLCVVPEEREILSLSSLSLSVSPSFCCYPSSLHLSPSSELLPIRGEVRMGCRFTRIKHYVLACVLCSDQQGATPLVVPIESDSTSHCITAKNHVQNRPVRIFKLASRLTGLLGLDSDGRSATLRQQLRKYSERFQVDQSHFTSRPPSSCLCLSAALWCRPLTSWTCPHLMRRVFVSEDETSSDMRSWIIEVSRRSGSLRPAVVLQIAQLCVSEARQRVEPLEHRTVQPAHQDAGNLRAPQTTITEMCLHARGSREK